MRLQYLRVGRHFKQNNIIITMIFAQELIILDFQIFKRWEYLAGRVLAIFHRNLPLGLSEIL